ncbi:MAG: ABC transporter permease [Bacteroidetes bacterium]|nr:ABC transporter permease [Bacteroidota bacterium]
MIRNFFIISMRRWLRDPLNSIINVFGLAAGLATTLLIMTFVMHETAMDKQHKQGNQIVRLVQGEWGLHAPALKYTIDKLPLIEKSARIDMQYGKKSSVRYGEKLLSFKNLLFTDASIFDIFQIEFVEGSKEQALKEPFSLVLTTTQAKDIFGDENPMGKIVRYGKSYSYTITAIVKPLENTHLSFNALALFDDIPLITGQDDFLNRVDQWNYHYYLKLAKGVTKSEASKAINDYLAGKMSWTNGKEPAFALQAIDEIYFDRSIPYEFGIAHGNSALVRSFALIGLLVLILAMINFINISTAKLADRAKEAGVKKTIGCSKASLIRQFLGESVLMSFMAMLIALLLVELLLPAMRNMLDKPLFFDFSNPVNLLFVLLIALVTGLLAGIIPALMLASYNPVDILKGFSENIQKKGQLRSFLTTSQFVVSIGLISVTIITWQQFQFLNNKPLGIDVQNIVYTRLSPEIPNALNAFETELKSNASIEKVALTNAIPGSITWQESFEMDGATKQFTFLPTTPEFLDMIDIKIIEGQMFSDSEAENEKSIIINRAAAAYFGWENPVGKIHHSESWGTVKVIGIAEDFHYQDATNIIGPLIIMNSKRYAMIVCVKYNPAQAKAAISHLEEIWQQFSPEFPLEYQFMENSFEKHYNEVALQGRVFVYFSLLALFIASLGLYGMAAYMTNKRRKEICIRKVHGASVIELYRLLAVTMLKLIGLAFVIASPLGYLFIHQWLTDFPYHININLLIFVFAGLAATIIALLTISGQLIRLSRINPAESLRYE